MTEVKPMYTSKTFWFNVIAVIVAVAGYFGYNEFVPDADVMDQTASIMDEVIAMLGAGFGLANIFLRRITDKPATFTGE